MSNSALALPARRLALSASKQLERWALQPERPEQRRREAQAYTQSLADRERHARDALALTLLR